MTNPASGDGASRIHRDQSQDQNTSQTQKQQKAGRLRGLAVNYGKPAKQPDAPRPKLGGIGGKVGDVVRQQQQPAQSDTARPKLGGIGGKLGQIVNQPQQPAQAAHPPPGTMQKKGSWIKDLKTDNPVFAAK